MDKKDLLILAIGVGITCFFAILAILASGKKPVYKKKGQLLLVNEQRFLQAALQALPPDLLLTAKVRLLDLVSSHNAASGKSLDRDLADFSVDFVMIDRTTSEVKLCIEMDSESQSASERIAKNTMISRALRRAGIPHVRLPLVRFYDPVRLRQIFRDALREADQNIQTPAGKAATKPTK